MRGTRLIRKRDQGVSPFEFPQKFYRPGVEIDNFDLRMADQRKFFVGGNWKMNGSKAKVDDILKFMNDASFNAEKVGKLI